MTKIYKDDLGHYAKVDGHIARPVRPTEFKKGDSVLAKHFGGSTIIGIGKLPGRAKYKEYWKAYDEGNFKYDPWGEYY